MAITNFQPEIWAAEILVNLHNELVYAGTGVINRNYEGAIAEAGDTVHITSFNDPAVRSYTKNADITWDLLTDSQQSLIVDQADYFAFTVDDIDKRQALGGFVEESGRNAGYGLANETDSYVSGLMVTALNGGAGDLGLVAMTAAENVYDNLLIPMRTQLNRSKAPASGRWCVVPPEVYAYLLKDLRFIDASKSNDPGALRSGFVGRAAGFDIYESNVVPDPTAGTYHVIAGHPWATTYADQIAKTEAVRLEKQFGDGLRGLHLYGAKVIRPTLMTMASVTVA